MSSRLRLDRRLTLEEPQRNPDGAGGYSEAWAALGHLWAQVVPQGGREEGDRSITRYRIVVRHAPYGAPSRPRAYQRFRDGARLYHIEAVTEAPGAPRHLMCYAYEENAA